MNSVVYLRYGAAAPTVVAGPSNYPTAVLAVWDPRTQPLVDPDDPATRAARHMAARRALHTAILRAVPTAVTAGIIPPVGAGEPAAAADRLGPPVDPSAAAD